MTDALTKSQKAAATIRKKRPKFFEEIGAEGGAKTPGTFKTKRGLAKKAGKRSGQARKIKGIKSRIDVLKAEMADPEIDATERVAISSKIFEMTDELRLLEVEFDGGRMVEGMAYE